MAKIVAVHGIGQQLSVLVAGYHRFVGLSQTQIKCTWQVVSGTWQLHLSAGWLNSSNWYVAYES